MSNKNFHLTADNKIFIARLPLDGKHWIVFGKTHQEDAFKTKEFKTYKEAYAYAKENRCHVDYILDATLSI